MAASHAPGAPSPGAPAPKGGLAASQPPSDWVRRFLPLIPKTGPVLDLACGSGRHLRFALAAGYATVGVDKDIRGLADLDGVAGVEAIRADLEDGGPWPLADRRFAGIIVTNYLWRPLFPRILDALAPDGVLLYETFQRGNGRFGRPSDPAFLLEAGELLERVRDRLTVVAFEQGEVSHPKAAVVQRLCAAVPRPGAPDLAGDPEPLPLPLASMRPN